MINKYFLLLFFFYAASQQIKSQNIGIGTSNPTLGKLEVLGAVGNTVAIFGGDGQGISIQRSNPCIGFNQYFDGIASRYIANGYAALQSLNTSTGEMYFDLVTSGFANNPIGTPLRAITIAKNGNIGIGMAPLGGAKLAVARGTGSYGTAVFKGTTWTSHINYSTSEDTYIRGGKSGSYVYLNDVSGGNVLMGNPVATATSMVKVGINSISPTYALQLKQFNNIGLVLVAANYANWQLKVGPSLAPGSYQLLYYNEGANAIGAFHPQTGAYAALSDERLKKDIVPLHNVSNQLSQLEPVQYLSNLPGLEPTPQAGFIAQDLMKVLPGLVMKQDEPVPGETVTGMHLVNYDGMAVYTIKIIQEQQQKIDELRRRLDTLKQKTEKNDKPLLKE
ncbi:MAG: tail fiber domain-containing protein [Ferruginibacter sp.]